METARYMHARARALVRRAKRTTCEKGNLKIKLHTRKDEEHIHIQAISRQDECGWMSERKTKRFKWREKQIKQIPISLFVRCQFVLGPCTCNRIIVDDTCDYIEQQRKRRRRKHTHRIKQVWLVNISIEYCQYFGRTICIICVMVYLPLKLHANIQTNNNEKECSEWARPQKEKVMQLNKITQMNRTKRINFHFRLFLVDIFLSMCVCVCVDIGTDWGPVRCKV